MAARVDFAELLKELEPVRYDKKEDKGPDSLDHLSLSAALLLIAQINPEKEYELCRSLAVHLLGSVPEPDDIDTGND
jgi:hypothetical protein